MMVEYFVVVDIIEFNCFVLEMFTFFLTIFFQYVLFYSNCIKYFIIYAYIPYNIISEAIFYLTGYLCEHFNLEEKKYI